MKITNHLLWECRRRQSVALHRLALALTLAGSRPRLRDLLFRGELGLGDLCASWFLEFQCASQAIRTPRMVRATNLSGWDASADA